MKVGLFVPCFIEQFYPEVALASLDLLERFGCDVEVPGAQTCCGQPLANAGFESSTHEVAVRTAGLFEAFDFVVGPSASCVLHITEHYLHLTELGEADREAVLRLAAKTFELCSFLTNVLEANSFDVTFRHRVGLHHGCHGLRGLDMGSGSELQVQRNDMVRELLSHVDGLEIVDLDRVDECCGFGGTFSVSEEAVSVRMGMDRLKDHMNHGAEVITSADMSCLMHLQGLARKRNSPVRFVHVAQILNGTA